MNKPAPDFEFLTWFIGFSEGDGSFLMRKRGAFVFGVAQHKKDIEVLNMIRNRFGFGKVYVQHNMGSFTVETKKELYLIGHLFNNNLVTVNKKLSFDKWLLGINKNFIKGKYILPSINLNPSKSIILPSLNDGWISGFTDAEGCFSVSIRKNNKRFSIIYDLSQNTLKKKLLLPYELNVTDKTSSDSSSLLIEENKMECEPVLHYLVKLFSAGCVYQSKSRKNVSYFRIDGLKSTRVIMCYFEKHPLLTGKSVSYKLWKELHLKLRNKEHLDPVLRDNLKILASQVNIIENR